MSEITLTTFVLAITTWLPVVSPRFCISNYHSSSRLRSDALSIMKSVWLLQPMLCSTLLKHSLFLSWCTSLSRHCSLVGVTDVLVLLTGHWSVMSRVKFYPFYAFQCVEVAIVHSKYCKISPRWLNIFIEYYLSKWDSHASLWVDSFWELEILTFEGKFSDRLSVFVHVGLFLCLVKHKNNFFWEILCW